MVNTAMALLAAGNQETPLRALIYLPATQHDDGGFSQNFWINGESYWRGIQLDEVAFPILLAWRLYRENALAEFDPYHMVIRAARYLIHHGPATQQERWEEASGYSPSTLAANIAALICAAIAISYFDRQTLPQTSGCVRLAKVAGITLYLHWSWFLVAVVEINWRRAAYASLAWNAAEYLALFGIVLLHEFGHALACRQVGGQADRIVLWPLGGIAFVSPPPRPGAVLWSIAAGPLVTQAAVVM